MPRRRHTVRGQRVLVTVNDGQQQEMVWDGDEWIVVPKREPADIWTYQRPVDPPADPEAQAARLARSAVIRAEIDRYLRSAGVR